MNRLLVLIVILLCTACPNNSDVGISGQDWQLSDWTAGTLPKDVLITATFADGRLSGKGVCNQYFADAIIKKDSILIKTVGATKMLCPKHADLERQYLQYLQNANAFHINKEGQLTLKSEEATLYFVPVSKE